MATTGLNVRAGSRLRLRIVPGLARGSETGHNYRLVAFYTVKLQNRAPRSTRTWSTRAKHTSRDRQIAGVATNVSPDVTRLDPHGDDDDSGQRSELDGRFHASSASHRAHNRFQLWRRQWQTANKSPGDLFPVNCSPCRTPHRARTPLTHRCKSAGYFWTQFS